jgi:hypothetical protein
MFLLLANIFISYSHRDSSALAAQLRTDLEARGHSIWLDEARLAAGSSWSRCVEDALDKSDVVIALLSAGSYESSVCRGEQLRSLRHNKCVIPLLAHNNVELPVYLEAAHYRNFSDPSTYTIRLEDLLNDIARRQGASLPPVLRKNPVRGFHRNVTLLHPDRSG